MFMDCALKRGDQVHIVTFPGRRGGSWRRGSSSVSVSEIPLDRPLPRMFSKRIREMMKFDPSAMYAIANIPIGDGPLPGGTGETVSAFRRTFPRRPIYVFNYTNDPGNAGWWTVNRVPRGGDDSDWPWVPMMDTPPPPRGVYLAAGTSSIEPASDHEIVDALRDLFGLSTGHGGR